MDVRNLALSLIAVAVAIVLLQYMQAVFIPLVLGAVLFYALDPAVDRMQAWHVPRSLGAALMLLLVVGSCGGLVYFLQDDAVRMVERLPQGVQRARVLLRQSREPGVLDKVQAAAKELEETTTDPSTARTSSGATRVQIEEPMFSASYYLRSGSVGVVSVVNQGIMILFLT